MQPSPKQLLAMLESESGEQSDRLRAHGGSSAGDTEDPSRLLHFGGPLSGPVVAIHASSEYAEAETGSGIYVAAQKQHLEQLVRHRPGPYRLIVGHLGWSAAQLRDEIARGVWHVVPATPEIVFAADHEMWTHLIRRATAGSVASWLGVRDVPGAAGLN
jgi:putative transcriptional regulator